jgi:YD repeat-containing protein
MQSYALSYKYDPVLNKYVNRITDSFDLESVAQYDPKFDVPTETMDASGNTTKYTYDAKGRVISILGPKE